MKVVMRPHFFILLFLSLGFVLPHSHCLYGMTRTVSRRMAPELSSTELAHLKLLHGVSVDPKKLRRIESNLEIFGVGMPSVSEDDMVRGFTQVLSETFHTKKPGHVPKHLGKLISGKKGEALDQWVIADEIEEQLQRQIREANFPPERIARARAKKQQRDNIHHKLQRIQSLRQMHDYMLSQGAKKYANILRRETDALTKARSGPQFRRALEETHTYLNLLFREMVHHAQQRFVQASGGRPPALNTSQMVQYLKDNPLQPPHVQKLPWEEAVRTTVQETQEIASLGLVFADPDQTLRQYVQLLKNSNVQGIHKAEKMTEEKALFSTLQQLLETQRIQNEQIILSQFKKAIKDTGRRFKRGNLTEVEALTELALIKREFEQTHRAYGRFSEQAVVDFGRQLAKDVTQLEKSMLQPFKDRWQHTDIDIHVRGMPDTPINLEEQQAAYLEFVQMQLDFQHRYGDYIELSTQFRDFDGQLNAAIENTKAMIQGVREGGKAAWVATEKQAKQLRPLQFVAKAKKKKTSPPSSPEGVSGGENAPSVVNSRASETGGAKPAAKKKKMGTKKKKGKAPWRPGGGSPPRAPGGGFWNNNG